MTHSFYTPEERREHLIGEGLVRISAGLEDLMEVDGVGEARAKAVREGLSRLAESSILERYS